MLNNILISRDLCKMLLWVKTVDLIIENETGSQVLFIKYLNKNFREK